MPGRACNSVAVIPSNRATIGTRRPHAAPISAQTYGLSRACKYCTSRCSQRIPATPVGCLAVLGTRRGVAFPVGQTLGQGRKTSLGEWWGGPPGPRPTPPPAPRGASWWRDLLGFGRGGGGPPPGGPPP